MRNLILAALGIVAVERVFTAFNKQRQRAKRERQSQAESRWEGEGGAPIPPAEEPAADERSQQQRRTAPAAG